MGDMWLDSADDPRSYGEPEGEKATLVDYLANYRLTLRLKCDDLDAEQLARRSVPPSTMSLLGLIRHMASVEHYWFRMVLQEHPEESRLHRLPDDGDWDFNGAVPEPDVVEDAFATWQAQIDAANEWLEALPEDGLGREVPRHGGTVSVRDVLVHMVEEYARHAGHADLLRECIDGRTGQ